MDFATQREMVHLRHELRRLLAEGRRKDALPLLERLRNLAERDAEQSGSHRPELLRWEFSLGLT